MSSAAQLSYADMTGLASCEPHGAEIAGGDMELESSGRFRLIPQIDGLSETEDASVALGWWFEQLLARVRWFAIPTCLMTVWLFPTIPAWLLLLPALGFGLGNVAVTWLLRQRRTAENLRTARLVAIAVDWTSTFASIYAFSSEPLAATPAILVLLSATTVLRFGLPGLIFSGAVTIMSISVLAVAQVLHFGVIQRTQAIMMVGTWVVVVGVTVLVLGVLSRGFNTWQSSERSIQSNIRDAVVRLQFGITDREWQVLNLLSFPHLTYEDIGRELSISGGTVKAHVRNIGGKLGVRGRHAVVAEAHRQGLLSPTAGHTTGRSYQRPGSGWV